MYENGQFQKIDEHFLRVHGVKKCLDGACTILQLVWYGLEGVWGNVWDGRCIWNLLYGAYFLDAAFNLPAIEVAMMASVHKKPLAPHYTLCSSKAQLFTPQPPAPSAHEMMMKKMDKLW